MRKFIVIITEVLTWILFAVATFLLARQTYFAMLGQLPDYSSSEGALIVAGIVTLTWLAMLGRIVLHLDKTMVDWFISLSLLISGIAVDVAVALSFVFEWKFPTHLALLVIVAHVVAHVAQWVVSAWQQSWLRWSGQYKSPEDRVVELELALARSEDARVSSQDALSKLEDAMKPVSWSCPDCGATFEHRSKDSLERAKRTHLNQRCPKRAIIGGNHRKTEEKEREI
ncbi:MAG: hypothetical protein JXB07_18990 [Anaerolineae bacterium]|nr:hypothetical protein [Anaerolineae bacterium]